LLQYLQTNIKSGPGCRFKGDKSPTTNKRSKVGQVVELTSLSFKGDKSPTTNKGSKVGQVVEFKGDKSPTTNKRSKVGQVVELF